MKKISALFSNVFLLLTISVTTQADELCLSGQSGSTNMIEQMTTAEETSSVTQIIYNQYKLNPKKAEGGNECPTNDCGQAPLKAPQDLSDIATTIGGLPAAPKMFFKSDCLKASLLFDSSANEVSCPSGKKSSSSNLCLTEKVMNYENAVISSFMSCAKKVGIPTVSPASVYEMYSVEGGFKPQFSGRDGVGLGQVTGIFVEDIHQAWRGRPYLEKIAQSNLKECDAAKIIAQNDLKKKPNFRKQCSFVSMGDGLERNVLYGIVGLATAWEKDIQPKMTSYLEKYKDDPRLDDVKNAAMLTAYGPGGRAAARALVSRLSTLPPEQFLSRIKKPMAIKKSTLNIYSVRMASRQKQINDKLTEPLKTEFSQNGGAKACVNSL
jgi:hypothetical protein